MAPVCTAAHATADAAVAAFFKEDVTTATAPDVADAVVVPGAAAAGVVHNLCCSVSFSITAAHNHDTPAVQLWSEGEGEGGGREGSRDSRCGRSLSQQPSTLFTALTMLAS